MVWKPQARDCVPIKIRHHSRLRAKYCHRHATTPQYDAQTRGAARHNTRREASAYRRARETIFSPSAIETCAKRGARVNEFIVTRARSIIIAASRTHLASAMVARKAYSRDDKSSPPPRVGNFILAMVARKAYSRDDKSSPPPRVGNFILAMVARWSRGKHTLAMINAHLCRA